MIIFKKGEKSMEKNWFSKTVTETSEYFKTDLKNLLTKNDLQNAIDVLNKNYGAFELGQKIEEPKKEEV